MGGAALSRVAEYYDKLSQFYDEVYRGEQVVKYLRARAVIGEPRRLLDAGCGTGIVAEVFPRSYVVCVELSEGMARRASERGIDVVLGDAWMPPLRPCSFDAALSITVVEPGRLSEMAGVLTRYARVALAESLGEWAVAVGCSLG